MTGTIPRDYGALSAVEVLNLRDNPGIIGRIPSELGALTALERLLLQGTSLTGSVPQELCDLQATIGTIIVVSRTDVTCDCCTSEPDAGAGNDDNGNGNGNPGANNDPKRREPALEVPNDRSLA
jgi:hypothetical protein